MFILRFVRVCSPELIDCVLLGREAAQRPQADLADAERRCTLPGVLGGEPIRIVGYPVEMVMAENTSLRSNKVLPALDGATSLPSTDSHKRRARVACHDKRVAA